MSKQPEALRLAAELDAEIQRTVQLDMMHHNAAAELRRLHIENEALGLHLSERMNDLSRVEAQRNALLEALRIAEAALSDIGDADREPGDDVAWCEARAAGAIPQVRAAIAKAEGEKA